MSFAATSIPLYVLAALIALGLAWWPFRAFVRAGGEAIARRWAFGAVALGALVCALVYGVIGQPHLPSQPLAARMADLDERRRSAPETLSAEEMRAFLNAETRRAPQDWRPHFFLGVLDKSEGRFEPAVRAFREALRRRPDDPQIMLELGAAMVEADGKVVSPEALALIEAAGAQMLNDPRPVFFQALAASQQSRKADAQVLWRAVLARLPADDPRRTMATRMLEEARTQTP
jgi:cytochrome c-type biogenesis protein CcmH